MSYRALLVLAGSLILLGLTFLAAPRPAFFADIPRTWDSTEVAAFMLHPPGVEVEPISEAYYYGLPERKIYKTYPVYHPDYEPEGYLDSLAALPVEYAFDLDTLESEADWIRAGELVFDQPHLWIPPQTPFGAEGMAATNTPHTRDGIFPFVKYTMTENGLRMGVAACANCHTRILDDGTIIKGAQGNFNVDRQFAYARGLAPESPERNDFLRRHDSELMRAPWIDHPSQTRLDTLTQAGYIALHNAIPDGVFIRQGTHYDFPARMPDLRGLRDHRFMDATGHMMNRSLGDVMRYAAFNEHVDFLNRYGDDYIPAIGHHPGPRPPADSVASLFNGPFDRFTDPQLYALAKFLYSLDPLPSPHTIDDDARARAERIFIEQGCVTCHPPPLYTNNMLTPALGYAPTEEDLERLPIFDISVETDPGLALYTRRGTGYYKIPGLRGLWYRGPFLHDGSLATLDDLFDPARLTDDYVPTGFKPVGVEHRAVPGHPFGMDLNDDDRAALVAYLKTL